MVDKETGESEIVPVANGNVLPVECHMELLNLNDEGHIYLECIEDNFENSCYCSLISQIR